MQNFTRIAFIVAMDAEHSAIHSAAPDWAKTNDIIPGITCHRITKNEREFILTKSGVGLVNAALVTDALINHYHVDAIILMGAGGALQKGLKIGDAILATHIIQHDSVFIDDRGRTLMRAGTLYLTGSKDMQLPPAIPTSSLLTQTISEIAACTTGTILSGSSFVATRSEKERLATLSPDALLVEMEAAGVALTCDRYKVPFAVVKTVSDRLDVDHGIAADYETFLSHAADTAAAIAEKLVSQS